MRATHSVEGPAARKSGPMARDTAGQTLCCLERLYSAPMPDRFATILGWLVISCGACSGAASGTHPASSFPGSRTAAQEPAPRAASASATPNAPAFANPDLPPEQRIDDLLSTLTLEEKVECLSPRPELPRLGLRLSGHVEGLHGLALGDATGWGRNQPVPTTTFPQSVGLGETWDPDLVRRAAEVEGTEARWVFHVRQRGALIVRAPNADLARDPRWGRSEESFGEDPHLVAAMATAYVRGLQGDDPRYWRTAALLKHFVANSNEAGRDRSSSDFDDRLFHEYYAAGFRAAIVDGGARAYMAAYNAHNGTPCTTHRMLDEITVRLWGQDGIKCTDGGALTLLFTAHRAYPDLAHAAAASVKAGISQFLDNYRQPIQDALAQGLLTEADLDRALSQNFRVMIKLGLLDPAERNPYAAVDPKDEPWRREAHKAIARLATQESMVLLKNERGLLPLDAARLGSVAVIGPRAGDVLFDWYSGSPPYVVSPVDGIRQKLGKEKKLLFARDNQSGLAVRAAKAADVAIVVVGNHPNGDVGSWEMVALPSYGREGVDRQSLSLEDEELIRTVHAANPRTVVVLLASFPYAIGWTAAHVPAIVHATHSSQELGRALADVLFGAYDPGGRLVTTWPRSLADLPPMMDYDIRHGRTYQYSRSQPLFPFGYGLSYTTFAYSSLGVSAESLPGNGAVTIGFDVRNTGGREGDEVAQLYVRHLGSRVPRPLQELKGFRRVHLAAGTSAHIELPLRAADLGYWDPAKQGFTIEPGPVEIRVGSSSADIRLVQTISVTE
jgi:beta-glucosidase